MAYQHDIFISYRRDPEVCEWINTHFKPLLKTNVKFELGKEPDVFVDDQLEAAGVWPLTLGNSIGSSRVLIILWTKTYLFSEWCSLEMSHMLEREKKKGFRTPAKPYSLVIPVIIHDGETMPAELSAVQRIDIHNFFTVRMHKESDSSEKLSKALLAKAADIADAINRAPAWEENWNIEAANEFYQKYYSNQTPVQQQLTTFT